MDTSNEIMDALADSFLLPFKSFLTMFEIGFVHRDISRAIRATRIMREAAEGARCEFRIEEPGTGAQDCYLFSGMSLRMAPGFPETKGELEDRGLLKIVDKVYEVDPDAELSSFNANVHMPSGTPADDVLGTLAEATRDLGLGGLARVGVFDNFAFDIAFMADEFDHQVEYGYLERMFGKPTNDWDDGRQWVRECHDVDGRWVGDGVFSVAHTQTECCLAFPATAEMYEWPKLPRAFGLWVSSEKWSALSPILSTRCFSESNRLFTHWPLPDRKCYSTIVGCSIRAQRK